MAKTKRTRGFEVVKDYKDKEIELPIRMTQDSAGWDFEAAEDVEVPPIWKEVFGTFTYMLQRKFRYQKDAKFLKDSTVRIKPTRVPTGIKAYMRNDEVLKLYNRSSNPLRFLLFLANGVAVIDADHYDNADNDGHIIFPFINLGFTTVRIHKGQRIGQGVFQPFLKPDAHASRSTNEKRRGGEGSTNRKGV